MGWPLPIDIQHYAQIAIIVQPYMANMYQIPESSTKGPSIQWRVGVDMSSHFILGLAKVCMDQT